MNQRQKIVIGISFCAGLVLLWSLREAPVSFTRLLTEPIHTLLGSPQQLQSGILEVSENVNTVQEATRRLFKPLGAVRLIRRLSVSPPSTTPAAPSDSSTTP